ncbi:TPA: hypothetical protein O7139_005463 [Salmonella enterica]|nr:hypothetical protein [Salmonella enterica]HDC2563320.1 hypothetical protein [Salmonella enterica]
MKMNKFSQKKKTPLILLLLSPTIFAASDNLNFNYSAPVINSLNPRFSLQTNVCHSMADPIAITVGFKKGMQPESYNISMTVNGAPVYKGYAGLSALASSGKRTADTDFQIPFRVSFHGSVKGTDTYIRHTPDSYSEPFCFDPRSEFNDGEIKYYSPSTYGYFPLFEHYPDELAPDRTPEAVKNNESDFQRYCGNGQRVETKDQEHFWSEGYPIYNPKIPAGVKKGMDRNGNGEQFLTSGLFYLKYIPAVDQPIISYIDNPYTTSDLINNADGSVTFTFPLYPKDVSEDSKGFVLRDGNDFVFNISNRNISSLILDISRKDSGEHSIFKWQRDSNSLSHILAFQGLPADFSLPSPGENNITNDPYQQFYSGDTVHQVFRGTLVTELSLKKEYENYIDNIMPLSLPTNTTGDINLVNTDSLSFLIGQDNEHSGSDFLRVYGQPLKFAPLMAGGKELASAKKVRDACY